MKLSKVFPAEVNKQFNGILEIFELYWLKCIELFKTHFQIIVGEDSGAVTIYELTKDEDGVPNFVGKGSRNDHDNCVLTISVSSDKSSVTTAGMDLW